MLRIVLLVLLALGAALAVLPFIPRLMPGERIDRWRGRLAYAQARLAQTRADYRLRWVMLRATGDVGELFFRRGKSNAWFLSALAGGAGPTLAEITAGVELSAAIAGMQGWETTLNRIQQPVLKYAQDYQVDGPQQFGDAQMTFLDDDGTGSGADITARAAVSTAMVEQATGWVVLSPRKLTPIAGTKVHVFPSKIGARNDAFSLDAELARYVIDWAITGAARKDVAVLA